MAILRDQLNIATKTDLINYVITDEAIVTVADGTNPFEFYRYDVNSTATHDGNLVIKPTAVMGAGRYLKIPVSETQPDWNEVDNTKASFIKNKPSTSGTVTSVGLTSGTGISVSGSPITGAGNITVTNTAPDQTVVLNNGIGISITGTYPNFTINRNKKQETFTGSTNGSGIYTVTYPVAYSVTPNVVVNFITSNPRDTIMLTASSTTGFTVQVQRRVDVVGLLPTYTNISGVTVDVLVTEK